MKLLPLHEAPYAWDEVLAQSVAGMHYQLEAGAAQGVQHAFLAVDDVLGVRVVVDQSDEKRAAERQAARLRVGCVADLLDDGVDACARLAFDERRLVDDARDGFLRDSGQAGDVVYGGPLSRDPVAARCWSAFASSLLPLPDDLTFTMRVEPRAQSRSHTGEQSTRPWEPV